MPSHPLRRHPILVGLAGVIAFGAAGGVATAATPGTVLLKQESPRSKTVTTTTVFNGRTVTAGLGVFHLQLTPQGQPTISAEGFCDDPLVGINGGVTYPISIQDLTDDPALDGANYRAAAYLIRTVDARLAAAADQSLESGATQIAVWQLGGRILAVNPTNDPVMNARAAALRALALSATAVAPGATAGASACAGTGTVDVTISGAAGTLGTVTVSSGSAVASNSQVVLDATGHATVHITASAAGQSVVRVQLATGKLVRAARTGTNGPQQTVMVIPATTEFNVPVTFTDCTPAPNPGPGSTPSGNPTPAPGLTPQSTPVTPGTQTPQGGTGTPGGSGTVPAVVQKPGLKVVKTGPRSARMGAALTYRIRLTNTGNTTLHSLVVSDPVPAGLFVPRNSATAARLQNGAVTFMPGDLKPGQSRLFVVGLRAMGNRVGKVCNVADVRGTDGTDADAPISAQSTACTTLKGTPAPIHAPAVTG